MFPCVNSIEIESNQITDRKQNQITSNQITHPYEQNVNIHRTNSESSNEITFSTRTNRILKSRELGKRDIPRNIRIEFQRIQIESQQNNKNDRIPITNESKSNKNNFMKLITLFESDSEHPR